MDINFKHKVPVQIRFNDADALGHINNTVYFSFYDLGKSEYFNTIRGGALATQDIDIVVAHAEVDFLSPILLTDSVEVHTAVSSIGNKSFTLCQQIVDTNDNSVKCRCKTVMVGFDHNTHRAKPISDVWRKAISIFEDKTF